MYSELALPANLSVGSFDAYVGAVKQLPTLSAEQERDLAARFHENNDLDAARQLIMANLRFVMHIARGYSGYGLALPDLIQEGNIGLMKAVKRYDPKKGVRLVSFAVHWIRAEIHEFVIRNWRIVKIATTKAQRKLFFNLRKSKKNLNWLSRDEASALADDLGVKIETVYEMEKRLDSPDLAYDSPKEDGSGERPKFTPAKTLKGENMDPAVLLEDNEWGKHKQQKLREALGKLDKRSREILTNRWLNENKSTLTELGSRYQVSAERIRQLEKNAMKKIKLSLDAEAL